MAGANGIVFGAGASVSGSVVMLPQCVQLRGNALEWRSPNGSERENYGRLDNACLRRFIRLANAPPEEIVRFVERYGPLLLGEHGSPSERSDVLVRIESLPNLRPNIRKEERSVSLRPWRSSNRTRIESFVLSPAVRLRLDNQEAADRPAPYLIRPSHWWYREPIEGYRAWARFVGIVYILSQAILENERTAPIIPSKVLNDLGYDAGPKSPEITEDSPFLERTQAGTIRLSSFGYTVYEHLSPWSLFDLLEWDEHDNRRSLQGQWDTLISVTNMTILDASNVEFKVALGGSMQRPRAELVRPVSERLVGTIKSVFPNIAGQLLAAITAGERTQQCWDCRMPYPVKRRRLHGRCPECRMLARSAAVQQSKARRREKDAAIAGS